MRAIVNFRTMKSGGYKWIKRGQARGYWRVLIVKDPDGPKKVNSLNVVRVEYQSPAGIRGVTERSNYYIDYFREKAEKIAAEFNAQGTAA